jgi:SpoVK/Ycf46/Vps4 family AAA+-type ATPase
MQGLTAQFSAVSLDEQSTSTAILPHIESRSLRVPPGEAHCHPKTAAKYKIEPGQALCIPVVEGTETIAGDWFLLWCSSNVAPDVILTSGNGCRRMGPATFQSVPMRPASSLQVTPAINQSHLPEEALRLMLTGRIVIAGGYLNMGLTITKCYTASGGLRHSGVTPSKSPNTNGNSNSAKSKNKNKSKSKGKGKGKETKTETESKNSKSDLADQPLVTQEKEAEKGKGSEKENGKEAREAFPAIVHWGTRFIPSQSIDSSMPSITVTQSARAPTEGEESPIEPIGLDEAKERLLFLLTRSHCTRNLPRGLILHGPPGCGKNTLIRYCAHRAQAELVVIDALSLSLNDAADNIIAQLQEVMRLVEAKCAQGTRLLLFLDELDTLCPRISQETQTELLTATLIRLLSHLLGQPEGSLVVVGSTNHLHAVAPGLLASTCLSSALLLAPPSEEGRLHILRGLCPALTADDQQQRLAVLQAVASMTPGYVGADLAALVRAAVPAEGESISVALFQQHLRTVGASLLKGQSHLSAGGGGVEGGGESAKPMDWSSLILEREPWERLQTIAKWRQRARDWNIPLPAGVLLYGPPGCGKTSAARLMAQSLHMSCITLTPAEVFSSFVGMAEEHVRQAFATARQAAPAVLFVDEVEAFGAARLSGSESSEDGGVSARVLSTFLNEMDGIGASNSEPHSGQVLLLAATNHPWSLDDAFLRPGRLDWKIHIPLPTAELRKRLLLQRLQLIPAMVLTESEIDVLVEKTELFSPSELVYLTQRAGILALRQVKQAEAQTKRQEALEATPVDSEKTSSTVQVQLSHFLSALEQWRPVSTKEMLQKYANFAEGAL